MKSVFLTGLAGVALTLVPTPVLAHGGQYRGPGDIVPPHSGGGGGRSGGPPSGPSTPRPGGPGVPGSGPPTGGPAGPGSGGLAGPGSRPGGPGTPGGMIIPDDFTRWVYWWEFNKDPFINLRQAVHAPGVVSHSDDFYFGPGAVRRADTLRPTDATIRRSIVPALKRALDRTTQRDITSSCLIALAKIGIDGSDLEIVPIFESYLSDGIQEIRETAALALGISQRTEAIDSLEELVADSVRGRELVARSTVDVRTRTFAAYGLGLIAHATTNLDVKTRAFEALRSLLTETDQPGRRNLKTAAINAIGLLAPDPASGKGRALLNQAAATLTEFYDRDLGVGAQLIQAHVPPALAKLLEDVDREVSRSDRERLLERFVGELDIDGRRKRRSNQLAQSAALALGRLVDPFEGDTTGSVHQNASKALLRYYQRGRNLQARYFALIALAQIGGDRNRDALLEALRVGKKALEKPWAAIALGVYAHEQAVLDPTIGESLRGWLGKVKNPDTRAALAIGLGLARYEPAADDLRALMIENQHQDELAGYTAIGLALMDDQRSIDAIRSITERSVRRPSRLQQTAIALGKLGDKRVAELLTEMLEDGEEVNLAKMSAIASALGFIGDHRSVDPLIGLLFNDDLTPISRAFAAVALGGVADKEPLPWNSKIAVNLNYRAAVETLTNRVNGILDIL